MMYGGIITALRRNEAPSQIQTYFRFGSCICAKRGLFWLRNSDGNLVASSFVAGRKGPRCFCTGVDLPNQRAAREATIVRMTPKLFGGGNWELYDADPKQNGLHCLPCIVLGLPSEHRNIGAGTGGEPESSDILRANRRPPVRRGRHLQDMPRRSVQAD